MQVEELAEVARRGRGRGRGRRVMRGGSLEYSPLPCYPQGTMLPVDPNVPNGPTYDASGLTDFDSTKQVGHETCVEYGTDGAELDNRAAGLETMVEWVI